MKSRVKMTCPVDGRSFGFVSFKGNAWEREKLREMVASWGRAHRACSESLTEASLTVGASAQPPQPGLVERSKPHRCGDCGLELLFGESCPFHSSSRRVRWSRELDTAYLWTVELIAKGLTPPNRDAVEYQAIVLARKWGGLQERVASPRPSEASA